MHTIGCQLELAWESPTANLARIEQILSESGIQPGSLFVLPEMFNTGFTMNAELAASAASATRATLRDLAKQHEINIIAGLALPLDDSGIGNFSLAIDAAGNEIGRYQKLFPFSLGNEDQFYTAGDEVALFDCGGFRLAPFVCYDLRFPEPFRVATEAGANLIVVIANWPAKRSEHWRTLLQARAIENLAFVVGVNRAGTDPHHEYAGDSLIVSPTGEILADAGDADCCISADLDLTAVAEWRENFPALRDRRSTDSFQSHHARHKR